MPFYVWLCIFGKKKKKNVQPGYTHQPFGDIYTIKADAALLFTGQVVNLCVV